VIAFKDRYFVVSLIFIFLASGGCSDNNVPSIGEGDPIVYVKRKIGAIGNPVDSITFYPGGDLYWRYLSTPSAKVVNVTGHLTLAKGDVSDPEPSYVAKKLYLPCAALRNPLTFVIRIEPGIFGYMITHVMMFIG